MTTVSLQQLQHLAEQALTNAGANQAMAITSARALVAADAQGLSSHGVARVAQYVAHLKNGRANGSAIARVVRDKASVCLVDAEKYSLSAASGGVSSDSASAHTGPHRRGD